MTPISPSPFEAKKLGGSSPKPEQKLVGGSSPKPEQKQVGGKRRRGKTGKRGKRGKSARKTAKKGTQRKSFFARLFKL